MKSLGTSHLLLSIETGFIYTFSCMRGKYKKNQIEILVKMNCVIAIGIRVKMMKMWLLFLGEKEKEKSIRAQTHKWI